MAGQCKDRSRQVRMHDVTLSMNACRKPHSLKLAFSVTRTLLLDKQAWIGLEAHQNWSMRNCDGNCAGMKWQMHDVRGRWRGLTNLNDAIFGSQPIIPSQSQFYFQLLVADIINTTVKPSLASGEHIVTDCNPSLRTIHAGMITLHIIL